jgi:ACS family tartrate transporter-like MFS transporter
MIGSVIAKVSARLLPLLFLLYFVNFLDRVNVGYAALQMNGDLGFTPEVYGLGASIFFLGYFFFEIPSNWMSTRVGARKWLARITLSWGIVACAMALVRTPGIFYVLRFLLGVAEAGFVPALLLYVSTWFPLAERANAVAKLWSSTAVALVFGGPLSALMLSIGGPLRGWQWMFLLEGIPAIALGFIVYRYLPDDVSGAAWLTPAERTTLSDALTQDDIQTKPHAVADFRAALVRPIVWGYAITYFCLGIGFFGITFWLPQIVKQLSGFNAVQTSLLSAVPFVFAAAAMLYVGARSNRSTERRFVFIGGCLIGALGVLGSALTADPWLSLSALTIGAMGIWSVVAIFWSSASGRMSGSGTAGGLALINSIGGLGGFTGPYMIGIVRGATHSFAPALMVIAVALVVCAALAYVMMRVPGAAPRAAQASA